LTDTGGFSLYRSEQVRSTDTAESLLQRMGVADPLAAAFLRRDTLVQRNLLGRTGRLVSAETSDDHSLQRLTARWAHDDSGNFKRLVVETHRPGLRITYRNRPTERVDPSGRRHHPQLAVCGHRRLQHPRQPWPCKWPSCSRLTSTSDAALRKGDRFSVVYETLVADGEPLRSGRVLSAEFVNNGKTHQALWFQEPRLGQRRLLHARRSEHAPRLPGLARWSFPG
jgi:hypothetical protein